MNIIIKNTEARLIELPAIAPKVATGREIVKDVVLDSDGKLVQAPQYMEPGTLLEEGFDLQQLRPGENDVDSDYWALICKKKGVKILIAAGYLEDHGEGKAKSLVEDIDKVDVGTAKSMILECGNVGVLTKWAEGTDNRGLKKLIGERKDELIDKADARIKVRGPKNPEVDLGTFGDKVTHAQVEGAGGPSHGVGEQAGA